MEATTIEKTYPTLPGTQTSNVNLFKARFKNKSKKPFGKTDENMKKNRYRNIVPYDTHRVPLGISSHYSYVWVIPGILGPNGDYINASYVKHYDQKSIKKYISTQGPLPNTIGDFWKMIYNEVKSDASQKDDFVPECNLLFSVHRW